MTLHDSFPSESDRAEQGAARRARQGEIMAGNPDEASGVLEWHNGDKSAWPRGEWTDEADKVQWVDATTGLDCLIVRGPTGALCGYVGVAEGHPYHGVDYLTCTAAEKCEELYCDHMPQSRLSVHGGITFADSCTEPTRERWEKWREQAKSWPAEAAKYPKGDAARRMKEQGHMVDDFDAWHAWGVASFICHVPLPGRPDNVWWLGFDCAHSGDVSPAYDTHSYDGWYKGRDYVRHECGKLADQLARIAHLEATSASPAESRALDREQDADVALQDERRSRL